MAFSRAEQFGSVNVGHSHILTVSLRIWITSGSGLFLILEYVSDSSDLGDYARLRERAEHSPGLFFVTY